MSIFVVLDILGLNNWFIVFWMINMDFVMSIRELISVLSSENWVYLKEKVLFVFCFDLWLRYYESFSERLFFRLWIVFEIMVMLLI